MTQDTALVLQLQAGNLEALGLLYDQYRLPVYRTALAITRDPAAAEDILQEAFLRLHTYAHRIKPELPLAPWLYRIAVNLSYTWVTRRNRWRAPLEDFIDSLIGPAKYNPEPALEQKDAAQRLTEAIATLPLHQRVVVVLHYLNELNLQEIADVLECPVGTVKSRLHYGREHLRQVLEGDLSALEVTYEFT